MTAPKLTPRKAPRQPRARATVDAILVAAEQLSRKLGVSEWTTNHVAERAGVSIGSLYQYFPSKESLVTALYLHRRSAHLARVAAALAELGDARVKDDDAELEAARAWLGLTCEDSDWSLDLALREFLLAAGAARKLAPIDEQAQRLLAQVLVRRGLPGHDAARRAFVVLHAVEGVIAAAARARGEWLTDDAMAQDLALLLRALRG